MAKDYKFIKNNPTDSIWWVDNKDEMVGEWLFSFDRKKVFNMFRDYPAKLTEKEIRIFDKENPDWADFFKDRKK